MHGIGTDQRDFEDFLRETEYRAEPFFTEAGLLDLAETMREIGFVDVEEYALQDGGYPWVTRGIKPERS